MPVIECCSRAGLDVVRDRTAAPDGQGTRATGFVPSQPASSEIRVPLLLFLAFLLFPLLELWVILQVGAVIGAGWTVGLLVLDSVVGAVIVRREGRRTWRAFGQALSEGRWPADEVAQGALVLVGGALLLTPGFVTDGIGLAFVLPPTRALLARAIRARVRRGAVHVIGFGPATSRAPGGQARTTATGQVLDVEVVSVERLDESDDDRDDPPTMSSGPPAS
jgi:UPF0716 protein FxsA